MNKETALSLVISLSILFIATLTGLQIMASSVRTPTPFTIVMLSIGSAGFGALIALAWSEYKRIKKLAVDGSKPE